jgi:hypothetical protein
VEVGGEDHGEERDRGEWDRRLGKDQRLWRGEVEETLGVEVEMFVEGVEGEALDFGEFAGGEGDHPGLAGAGASMGVGREVGGVGFDHEAIEGDEFGGILDFGGVAVGEDSCEGDVGAEVQDLSHVGGGAGEAMEDEAGGIKGGLSEDGEEVVEGFAAVEDDGLGEAFVRAGLDEGELFGENFVLDGAGRAVVMVVEAELTPGDAAWVASHGFEVGPEVWAFVGVERVDAGGTPDVRVRLGDGEGVEAVGGGGGDGDAGGDAVLAGEIEDAGDA